MDANCRKINIEIPIFLFFFAAVLCSPISINFVIYRTCYVTMGFNESDCAQLGNGKNDSHISGLEKVVQPKANLILITSVVINQIVPPILCLFVGSWSDKNGRRRVLLTSLAGYCCVYIIKAVISFVPSLSPWYLLLEFVPIVLTGGFSTFLMISICYATDITSVQNRGMRMGVVEISISMGILLGTLSSSYLFKVSTYSTVFLTSALCVLAAFGYTKIFLKESIVNISEIQDKSSLLSLVHVKDMLKTAVRSRSTHNRAILLLLIISLTLYILAINNGDAKFLFLRNKFNWSVGLYTIYSSIHTVLWMLGTFVGVYLLHKLLSMPESVLLIIGYASMSLSTLLQGVATMNWHIYVAAGVQGMGAVITPMSRSLISKVVEDDEVGKVFALTTATETFAAIISNTLNSLIYNSTIDVYPGAFNFYGTVIYTLTIGLIIMLMVLQNKQRAVYPLIRAGQYNKL